tara:strand:- start:672 stop:1241 length:570 start_codon:yes stop_codon:yes gene_type:complete
MGNAEAQFIHDFWFGKIGSKIYGKDRRIWFEANKNFDSQCKNVMEGAFKLAIKGHLDHWLNDITSAVALCLLLDQYPRNAFRFKKEAYLHDDKARSISINIISNKLDAKMIMVQREFVYMPFMHSENLIDQKYSLDLFKCLGDIQAFDAALSHFEIIDRFGRFPHRNAILGRESTPEEVEFLKEPNSSF